MKVLVTGASGFLGHHVVDALVDQGHQVRAMVRSASGWTHADEGVELFRADLRVATDLLPAFEGIDTVIHLAAHMGGTEPQQMAGTVGGTERLLQAMAGSQTKRLILAGSVVVYDWMAAGDVLTEDTPLETHLDERDAYTVAKHYQERVVRRASTEHGWDLTVLRPGWIWGRPDEYPPRIGRSMGSTHLVFGPRNLLPLTHVRNCAHCFAQTIGMPAAAGESVNVFDDYDVTSWQFLKDYLDTTGQEGTRVPVPWPVVRAVFGSTHAVSNVAFGRGSRLSLFSSPRKLHAGYRPIRFDRHKLSAVLDWRSPLSYEECFRITYGAP